MEYGEAVEEGPESEITRLCEEARIRVAKVDENAGKQKKQIINELAQSLEGKVGDDNNICMTITRKLKGHVSPSFIRECLDEKYKQKVRVENAKKQKRGHHQHEVQEIEAVNLAPLPSLKNEEERKKVLLVGADGRTLLQEYGERDGEDMKTVPGNQYKHQILSLEV